MDLTEHPSPIGGIDVTSAHGRTLVRLWGDIDGALRAEASTSMARALASTAPIVVDATDVRLIDPSGLAFVLQLHLAATETGQRVALRDPHRRVVDKLEILGLAGELGLDEDRAIA